MAYRATKSGIGAEAQEKLNAKYDPELAAQCLEWTKSLISGSGEDASGLNTAGDNKNFHAMLKDGYYLARLANVLMPGSVPANKLSKRQTMPFKQMELIGTFVEKVKGYGVPDYENFATVDLHEAQNLSQVVICLQTLGRKAKAQGLQGFGPKEADKNERHFTDQQLKEGQNIIGLQMGTNKGASQAGQSFGKTRMIVD